MTPKTPAPYALPFIDQEAVWAVQNPDKARGLPFAAPCISEEMRYYAAQQAAQQAARAAAAVTTATTAQPTPTPKP